MGIAQDSFLVYFFLEIWRFEKRIALSEKKPPLSNIYAPPPPQFLGYNNSVLALVLSYHFLLPKSNLYLCFSRNTLNEIYFGKTRDIVNGLRSVQPLDQSKQQDDLRKDLVIALASKNVTKAE